MASVGTAASHYYNGCFRQASHEFSLLAKAENVEVVGENKKRMRSERSIVHPPIESQQLMMYAHEADAALCKARSLLADSNAQRTLQILTCREALNSNTKYRRYLRVAIPAMTTETVRQECATSSVLAGVSAAWLCLQLQKVTMAYQVALESVNLAVSFLSTGQDFTPGGMITLNEGLKFLSGSIHNLNVVRTMRHALQVLDLSSETQYTSGTISYEEVFRSGENATTSEADENSDSGDTSDLRFRSREQLVRALSLGRFRNSGTSIVELKTSALRQACLERAVSLETSGECGSLSKMIQSFVHALEAFETKPKLQDQTENMDKHLEHMSLSSKTFSVHNLMGCLHAVCPDNMDRALYDFRMALELQGNTIGSTTADYREVVSNMTECCLFLGQSDSAKDLLLHLQGTMAINSSHPSNSQASQFLLSTFSQKNDDIIEKDSVLLWRLFLASTLADDNAGQKACLSLKLCQRTVLSAQSRSIDAILALFEADAGLVTKTCVPADLREGSSSGISSIQSLVASAMSYYKTLSNDRGPDFMEFGAIIYNNNGVSLLLQGKTAEAIACFREATKLLPTREQLELSDCFLQPHFNLALSHWRHAEFADAVGVWLSVRGLLKHDETKKGAMNLELLRRSLDDAIDAFCDVSQNKHYFDAGSYVSAWQSGTENTSLGGMDSYQVRLMDAVMLQCAVDLAACDRVQQCASPGKDNLLSQLL